MNRNNALVAVSTGLLANMSADEAESVLGHEVSHRRERRHGDPDPDPGRGEHVRHPALARRRPRRGPASCSGNARGYGPGYFIAVIVAQVVLSVLASIIVMWFSRRREYRADEGGAALAGRGKMIAALRRLRSNYGEEPELPSEMAALGISGRTGGGFAHLFRSHPPLDDRIAAPGSRRRPEDRAGEDAREPGGEIRFKDYDETLGVEREASPEDVRAYRRLARNHPHVVASSRHRLVPGPGMRGGFGYDRHDSSIHSRRPGDHPNSGVKWHSRSIAWYSPGRISKRWPAHSHRWASPPTTAASTPTAPPTCPPRLRGRDLHRAHLGAPARASQAPVWQRHIATNGGLCAWSVSVRRRPEGL